MAPMQLRKARAPAAKSPKTTPSPIQRKAGPRKPGTNARKTNPKRRARRCFAFLDLPGEIRNTIYQYALVDSNFTISIEDKNKHNNTGLKRHLLRRSDLRHQCLSDVPEEEFDSRLNKRLPWKWRLNGRLCPELLAVCKQINAEATSYLYGGNYLVFLDARIMTRFLLRCGSQIHLIRRIGIAHWDLDAFDTYHSGFMKLTEAANLKALVLGDCCLAYMAFKRFWYSDDAARFNPGDIQRRPKSCELRGRTRLTTERMKIQALILDSMGLTPPPPT
ncbi:hypothetical protein K505DRAFT_339402 [Melanomma pulvis-pyrius CBS 109.77]|uniref:DUF7730 domain-containing protein n=1 Tax=Melanomma pulvis-pyrius CBS 109.77 TaxID=1314802 RepID=A0A6A6X5H8_9PLEO|nr:hypothetical protein K505DRAFT_339402 [Melanomma pulvis-pyrius CBS 109.77]